MKRSSKKHTVALTSTDTFPTSSLSPSSSLLDGTPAILDELKVKNPEFNLTESIKKSRNIASNFIESLKTYPKYISYEAATVLNVAFALGHDVFLNKLPIEDQDVINSQLDSSLNKENVIRTRFIVEMDEMKDFKLVFNLIFPDQKEIIRIFNTVIHQNPADNNGVPLKIGNLDLENKSDTFRYLAGIPEKKLVTQYKSETLNKSANKNAFEIRSDVLSMAIKWASLEDGVGYEKPTDDQLINLARKFYDFVENKRN